MAAAAALPGRIQHPTPWPGRPGHAVGRAARGGRPHGATGVGVATASFSGPDSVGW